MLTSRIKKSICLKIITSWDGGDALLVSGMVSNDLIVKHDSDFDAEGFWLTLLNSDFGKDFLDFIEINDTWKSEKKKISRRTTKLTSIGELTSGHGHDSGGKRFSETFQTDEEGKVVGAVSSRLSVESNINGPWEQALSTLLNRDSL